MLGDKDAIANVAVKDLGVARRFYQETLGLTPVHDDGEEVIVFRSGNTMLQVYRSQYAGTNRRELDNFFGAPDLLRAVVEGGRTTTIPVQVLAGDRDEFVTRLRSLVSR